MKGRVYSHCVHCRGVIKCVTQHWYPCGDDKCIPGNIYTIEELEGMGSDIS